MRKFVHERIHGTNIRQLDTGDISTMNMGIWKKIVNPMLRKTAKSDRRLTGHKLHFIVEVCTNVTFLGKTCNASLHR